MPSKIHLVNGHRFQATSLRSPTVCTHCNHFIYGIGKQGYQCKGCYFVVHKKCHKFVKSQCKIGETDQDSLLSNQQDIGKSHSFQTCNFKMKTLCHSCGLILAGRCNQGLTCTECGANVHVECSGYYSMNCGRNA